MIRFFQLITLVLVLARGCAPALAQGQYPIAVTNAVHLVSINPNGLKLAVLTNGGGIFRYNSASTAATNTTDTFKPTSYAGRWELISVIPGVTAADIFAAGTVAANLTTVSNSVVSLTATTMAVKTVANLAALKALSFSTNYSVVFVLSDADGFSGSYWWDATIVTADDDGNGIIALNSGTGGFERRGL